MDNVNIFILVFENGGFLDVDDLNFFFEDVVLIDLSVLVVWIL